MFNKKQRPAQVAQQEYEDLLRRKMDEWLLRADDNVLSQASLMAAERIVYAFAAFREMGVDYIPDERKLPYPKEVIRLAFRKRIAFCRERCRQEPNNSEWKKDLGLHESLNIYLSDFQAIDPEDEALVRAANEWNKQLDLELSKFQTDDQKREYLERVIESDEPSAHERLVLESKYFKRAMKENGITPFGEPTQYLETLRTPTLAPQEDESSQRA